MNYLIQQGKIRSQVINIPEGLPELLSDITREVLRCQPTTECLCQFIIDYLHSVIVAREKARMAKMAIDRALRIVDEVIADICICDIPKIKADKMSEAMEECFKRFLAQRRCEKGKDIEIIKFNEIDMLDELILRCKFSEEELKISKPIIEAAYQKFVDAYMTAHENSEGTEILYQYFRERELKRMEEQIRQEAALKIQANFRGFLARRSLFLAKEAENPLEEVPASNNDYMELEVAARKIQRFFRGHLSDLRKDTEMSPDKTYEFQDICTPESNISLTVRSPGLRDSIPADNGHNEDEGEQQKQNQSQTILREEPVNEEFEIGQEMPNETTAIQVTQSQESLTKGKEESELHAVTAAADQQLPEDVSDQ